MPCVHKGAYACSTQKLLLFTNFTRQIDKQYMMQLIIAMLVHPSSACRDSDHGDGAHPLGLAEQQGLATLMLSLHAVGYCFPLALHALECCL